MHTTFSFATYAEAESFFDSLVAVSGGIACYMDAVQTMFGFTVWVEEPFRESAIEIYTRPE